VISRSGFDRTWAGMRCTGWGPEDAVGGSVGRRCWGTVMDIVGGLCMAWERRACLRRAICCHGASWVEGGVAMVMELVCGCMCRNGILYN